MTGLRFSKDHEWARIEGDAATCGISDYAQKALGDVVYVELPPVGKKVKQGEQVAVVESVKAASEVYAPLSGEVVAVNADLTANPALINSVPYAAGWFFKIKPANVNEADALMNEEKYQTYVQGLT